MRVQNDAIKVLRATEREKARVNKEGYEREKKRENAEIV